MVVEVWPADHLHHWKGEEGALEEEEEEEAAGVLLLLVETRVGVAGLDSQLLAVGEEVEVQNQGEVGKMEVKVVVGSLETQILQVGVGVECPSWEVEVEGQVVEQNQAWGLVETEEELVVGGLG